MRREMMYTPPRYRSTVLEATSHVAYEKRALVPVSFLHRPQLKRVSYARAYMRGIRPGLGGAGREQQNARNSARPIF